jgi:hypothetical protein
MALADRASPAPVGSGDGPIERNGVDAAAEAARGRSVNQVPLF